MSDPDTSMWFISVIFTIIGPVIVVLGIRNAVRGRRQQRTWIRYRGEAFDYVWNRGNQFWMLRWIDRDGVQRTAQNPYGNSAGTLRTFPFPVDILVDPTNPRKARVAGGANSGGLFSVLAIVVGCFFGFIGAVLLGTSLLFGR